MQIILCLSEPSGNEQMRIAVIIIITPGVAVCPAGVLSDGRTSDPCEIAEPVINIEQIDLLLSLCRTPTVSDEEIKITVIVIIYSVAARRIRDIVGNR